MPSNAGSPNIGTRKAQPLLPVSPSLNSNSSSKLPYSFSLSSQLPRGSPPCNTPFSIFQTGLPSAGLRTSFQARTTQPFGTPSSENSGTNARSAERSPPAMAMENSGTSWRKRLVFIEEYESQRADCSRLFFLPIPPFSAGAGGAVGPTRNVPRIQQAEVTARAFQRSIPVVELVLLRPF